jgi:hypothetical protein
MTTRAPRYAEGTRVSVDASRAELSGILTKHGVRRQGWSSDDDQGDVLLFELAGASFRLHIDRPTEAEVRTIYSNLYAPQVDWTAKVEGEWRRRWRANVLLLKAKLEFISAGDTTLERELLPYRVLADGRTLLEAIATDSIPLLQAGKR